MGTKYLNLIKYESPSSDDEDDVSVEEQIVQSSKRTMISLNTSEGVISPITLRLYGEVKKQQLSILVDSGQLTI